MTYRFNDLAAKIHAANAEKGFYDNPKELGTLLMLIVGELGEALEADRKDRHPTLPEISKDMLLNKFDTEPLYAAELFRKHVKDTVEDEIADTLIRLFDLAGYMNLDLDFHVQAKLRYNSTRPKRHGKSY